MLISYMATPCLKHRLPSGVLCGLVSNCLGKQGAAQASGVFVVQGLVIRPIFLRR